MEIPSYFTLTALVRLLLFLSFGKRSNQEKTVMRKIPFPLCLFLKEDRTGGKEWTTHYNDRDGYDPDKPRTDVPTGYCQ